MERSKTIISIVVGLAGLLIIWKVGWAPLEPIQIEQTEQQVASDAAATINQDETAPPTDRQQRPQRGGMRGGMFDPNMTGMVADANEIPRDARFGRRGMGGQQAFGMGMMNQTPTTSDPNELVTANLNGVDIRSLVQTLMNWTGKSIIPTSGAENVRITVFAPQMLPKNKALELLYKALRVQGYVAEDDGDTIFIKPISESAQMDSAPIIDADTPLATIQDREKIVQKFFRLKNTSPSQIAQILYQLLGDSCFISADDSTSTLLVIDSVRTLMRAELLINKYDIDLADTFTEIFEIRHRDPEEIVQMLETLVSYGSSSSMMNPMSMFGNMPTSINIGGTATRGRTNNNATNRTDTRTRGGATARGSASTQQIRIPGITQGGANSVNVQTVQSPALLIAETRNKWVIARATVKDMELIRYWINKLDTAVNIVWDVRDLVSIENKNQIVQYFFQLEYYSPEQMLQIIEPMLGDSGYASAEENTGTLLVIDTVENLLNFQGIIDRFDGPTGERDATAIFEVKNGDPTEIVQLIQILMGEDAANSRTIGGTGRTTTTTNRNLNTTTRTR